MVPIDGGASSRMRRRHSRTDHRTLQQLHQQ